MVLPPASGGAAGEWRRRRWREEPPSADLLLLLHARPALGGDWERRTGLGRAPAGGRRWSSGKLELRAVVVRGSSRRRRAATCWRLGRDEEEAWVAGAGPGAGHPFSSEEVGHGGRELGPRCSQDPAALAAGAGRRCWQPAGKGGAGGRRGRAASGRHADGSEGEETGGNDVRGGGSGGRGLLRQYFAESAHPG